MFLLGHVGIGSRLLLRWRRSFPVWPLYFGCVLPDLIDKPLFYLHLWRTLVTGTRSFGHTLLFLLSMALLAALSRRRALWAVAAGIATHLALDIGGEFVTGATEDSSIWLAIFFPACGPHFPVAHFDSFYEHLRLSAQNFYVLFGELIGAAILISSRIRRAAGPS